MRRLAFARLCVWLRPGLSGGLAGFASLAVCVLFSPSASTCSNRWWVCLHLCCLWHNSFSIRLFNRHLLCMHSPFGSQRLRHRLHKPRSLTRLSLAAGGSPRNSLMSPGFLRDTWPLQPSPPAALHLCLGGLGAAPCGSLGPSPTAVGMPARLCGDVDASVLSTGLAASAHNAVAPASCSEGRTGPGSSTTAEGVLLRAVSAGLALVDTGGASAGTRSASSGTRSASAGPRSASAGTSRSSADPRSASAGTRSVSAGTSRSSCGRDLLCGSLFDRLCFSCHSRALPALDAVRQLFQQSEGLLVQRP